MGNLVQGVWNEKTVSLPVSGTGPVEVSVKIRSSGSVGGYNPAGIAEVEYYNSIVGRSVKETIPIGGGFGPTVVTVKTGSLIATERWIGEIRVTPIDNPDNPLKISSPVDSLGKKTPGWLSKALGTINAIDDGISGIFGVSGYKVNIEAINSALQGGVLDNVNYAPGFLEGLGLDPKNLGPFYKPVYDPEGNFVGIEKTGCFAAGTLVSLPEGATFPIEKLSEVTHVSSFDEGVDAGRGALQVGRIVKLYHNVTQEFLRLSFADNRESLVVTPGHAFLDETGAFTKIGELVEAGNGTARVVDQTGEVIEVSAELLRFDDKTADLFERSSKRSVFVDGKCVLNEDAPEGWKTYNFEVEGLHTYVAGGVRVHNDSGFLGQVGNTIDDVFFDKLGTLGDGIGDIVTSPFHVAGEILDGAARAVGAIGTGISKGISRFSEGDIFGGIAEIGKGIGNAFSEIGRTAVETVREIGSSFAEGISKVGKGISDFVGDIFGDNDSNDGKDNDSGKPVILDLDGDGIEVNASADVDFDMDADGFLEQTAWAAADDGFLVMDLNADGTRGDGDGKIDQTKELVLSKWLDWDGATDLQALATFDEWESRGGNNDGVLDAQDEVWSELHVWQDLNQNGITDEGELKSLEQLGITQINLKYDDGTDYADLSNDVTIYDNTILGRASYTRNGEVIEGGVGDMSLSYTAEGWRRVETDTGFRIEFENNENYEYRVLDGTGSTDVNLAAAALGGATGDARNNHLDASGYDTAVQLTGGDGNDTLTGGNQDDLISGDKGADQLRGGDGDDILFFDEHDTVVLGGNGHDNANYVGDAALTFDLKSHQIEELHAGEGDDTITASGATESVIVFGYDGNDTLNGGLNDDALSGGQGNDILRGHDGGDFLQGEEGADKLYGGNDEDELHGSAGNDELHGEADNDRLSGGSGADKLFGGSGDDTYFFSRGDGHDTVEDTSGAADAISFGLDIELEDLSLVKDGNDLVIYVLPQDNHAKPLTDVTDTIRIQNWRDTNKAVETLAFASGLTFSLTDLKGNLLQATGTQTVTGSSLRDWIEGHAGNDTLHGGNGNDVLQGRDGNDTLEGGDGIDTLVGGKGNDTLKGGDSTDVLTGGEGSDRLGGGSGNDVYTYQRGDGKDTISDSSGDQDMLFLSDLTLDDVTLRRDGNDMVVYVLDKDNPDTPLANLEGSIRIQNWNSSSKRIDTLRFADGFEVALTEIIGEAKQADTINLEGSTSGDWLEGQDVGESILGNSGHDVLIGRAGNDTLKGGAGNDTYLYSKGDGKDTINDTSGSKDTVTLTDIRLKDVAIRMEGNDLKLYMLEANAPDKSLSELDGSITIENWTSSAQRIEQFQFKGGSVIEKLHFADGGNDTITGSTGSDTYVWSRGDGNDTIYDTSTSATELDRLILEDVVSSEVDLVRSGIDIKINIQAKDSFGQESIKITRYLYAPGYGYGIEEIQFSDGKIWDLQEIFANIKTMGTHASETLTGTNRAGDNIYGLGGNDTLIGHQQNDHLYGGTGDDELYGHAGNDTLEGGTGTDYLNGDVGNDTYVWSRGDGNDTLYDTSTSLIEIDRLTLTDVLSSEVELVRLGNGIQIRIQPKGSSGLETINITNQIASSKAGYGIEELEFSGGQVWDLEDIFANTRTLGTNASETMAGSNRAGDNIYGLGGNDTLIGHDQGDHLYGGTGNDELYGKNGDDTLEGGIGTDYLNGSSGNDTYVWSRGDGNDTLYDTSKSLTEIDRLTLTDVLSSEVELVRLGNGIQIRIQPKGSSGLETINITNQIASSKAGYGIEELEFSDGKVWDLEDIFANTRTLGTNASETLAGSNRAGDNIYGLGGNDTLIGHDQGDHLYGGIGNDELYGKNGDDTLNGGSGADYLNGGSGSDVYVFDNLLIGHDRVYDFTTGAASEDIIRFDTDVFSDMESVLAATDNVGTNAVIKIDDNNSITLLGVSQSDLHADDFQFV